MKWTYKLFLIQLALLPPCSLHGLLHVLQGIVKLLSIIVSQSFQFSLGQFNQPERGSDHRRVTYFELVWLHPCLLLFLEGQGLGQIRSQGFHLRPALTEFKKRSVNSDYLLLSFRNSHFL